MNTQNLKDVARLTDHWGRVACLVGIVLLSFWTPLAQAASGTWTNTSGGTWSTPGSWSGSVIADGSGSTADFSTINITTGRTITIDGAVASRTLGSLIIGDTTGAPAFSGYTIASSGSGTLTFDNGGSGAVLTQAAISGANVISAPVILADNLTINNNSDTTLSITTGGITGAYSITNQGSGVGGVSIGSGVIALGVTGVFQDSATSSLTLSGTNTFNTGVTIKKGTVIANNNAALGTATTLLGDTSGSADATLLIGSFTVANNITVQAGSSGTLTLGTNGGAAARPTGNIVLNNDLTVAVTDGGSSGRSTGAYFNHATGSISGTGDLNINVSGNLSTSNNTNQPQMDSLSLAGAITTTGDINNVGTGSGKAAITGNINNASSLNQNSATSLLSLSGTNTYSGATNVTAGVLRISANSALSANSSSVNVSSGGTLQLQNGGTALNAGQTLNISGTGASYTYGAIESTNSANFAGSVVLQGDSAISSDLANTTLTLSGGITGSGRTLTTSGVGSVTISGDLNTGSGGLIKQGTGVLTLSGSNGFTGVTQINNGTLLLSSAGALGGGGAIRFDGGAIRHSASNELDLGSRISGSAGPIAIDTNSRNVTYSGIAAGNNGGLTKLGSGRLTLSGTNSYSGPTVANTGVLAVDNTGALPGQVFIDSSGALNTGGAYATLGDWMTSGKIASGSTGVIAITGGNTENIDFTGYSTLGLGATSNGTYTGTITAAGSTYRLGGGGATLTLSGTNALNGGNGLVVSGNVTLSGANNMSGATTVSSSTLALIGGSGGLAGSVVTVNPGAVLAITSDTGATPVVRASAVTLSRGTLTVTGNSVGNSTDAIANALTIGSGGNSTITVSQSNAKNVLLTSDSLVRNAGGTALIRGTNLGVNTIASKTASSTNIQLNTPNLVGSVGANTTDGGILVGMVGDSSAGGTGFGSTGGLLTHDATYGVRLVGASEYKTSITDGQSQLDNIRLTKATAGAATTTLNSNTTVNSLSINTSGNAAAAVAVNGSGTLTLNSGVIYAGSTTSTTASTISNAIDFNGREGVILAGGTADLNLSGVLGNTGGNGLTLYGNTTNVSAILSGTAANTYTGTTTVNGGRLEMNKTAGVNAIGGNLLVNTGGTAVMVASNQIDDSADVTINGGLFYTLNETINNLTISNGGLVQTTGAGSNTAYSIELNVNGDLAISSGASLISTIRGKTTVAGTTNLSDGGTMNVRRAQNVDGSYDSITTLGPLNITNSTSGAYTAITIDYGSGLAQSGGQLVLNGDVTFTGNATNTNTVVIDAIKGSGRQGQVALRGASSGNRTFNIGNGAAAVDLAITAPLVDGTGGASGLTKTGLGTLALTGSSTYTGATAVSGGTLLVSDAGSINSTSGVTVNTGGTFRYNSSVTYSGGAISNAGGSITGSGSLGSLTLGGTGSVDPGNSPGLLEAGATDPTGGLDYNFEFTLKNSGLNYASVENDVLRLTSATPFTASLGSGNVLSIYLDAASYASLTNGDFLRGGFYTDNGNFLTSIQGATITAYYQDVLGSTTYNGNTYSLLSGGSFGVTTVADTNFSGSGYLTQFNYSAIPEPSTYALLGLGVLSLWVLRRKKQA